MNANAWHTLGSTEPLQARWDEAASKVIALGGTPIHPVLDASVYRMLEWLKQNQPRKVEWTPPSPAQKLADAELDRALTLYHATYTKVVDELKLLDRHSCKQRASMLGIAIDESLTSKPLHQE
jgi:hypothetical protein